MNAWKEERNQKTIEQDVVTAKIFSEISGAVEKAGFTCSYVAYGCDDEGYKRQNEISIKKEGFEYFEATIEPRYNAPGKHRFSVKGSTSIQETNYAGNQYSKTLCFDSYISHDAARDLGLVVDYRVSLYSLAKEFKSTKSTKLILNDILPRLETYEKAMRIIEPALKQSIDKNNQTLALQNAVAMACGTWTTGELKERNYTLPGNLGRLCISEYGTITHTKELTPAALSELLGLNQ